MEICCMCKYELRTSRLSKPACSIEYYLSLKIDIHFTIARCIEAESTTGFVQMNSTVETSIDHIMYAASFSTVQYSTVPVQYQYQYSTVPVPVPVPVQYSTVQYRS